MDPHRRFGQSPKIRRLADRRLKKIKAEVFAIASTCMYSQRRLIVKSKGKGSSLDIVPLTILNSGALQPRKWQLTGNDCSTAAHAVAAQSAR